MDSHEKTLCPDIINIGGIQVNLKTLVGSRIYLDESNPELNDPAKEFSYTAWQPYNHNAMKLMKCVEALREIKTHLIANSVIGRPLNDKRSLQVFIIPLFKLIQGTTDIFNELEGNAKSYNELSKEEKREINKAKKLFEAKVPFHKGSDIRTLRDKLAAHTDNDAVTSDARVIWNKVESKAIINWLNQSLNALRYLLSINIYHWYRSGNKENILGLMMIDGNQINLLMKSDGSADFNGTTFAKSPKYSVSDLICEINELSRKIF